MHHLSSVKLALIVVVVIVLALTGVAVVLLAPRAHVGPPAVNQVGDAQSYREIPTDWQPADWQRTKWQRIQTDTFSIGLPQGWVFIEKQGIDSYIGEFQGDGITLLFDYGWYSGDPSQDNPDYTVTEKIINGFTARLFTSEKNQDAGVYFDNVGGEGGLINKLSVYGSGLSKEDHDLVFSIFSSIRFKNIRFDNSLVDNSWEVYTNTELGITLRHPSDWKLKEKTTSTVVIEPASEAESSLFRTLYISATLTDLQEYIAAYESGGFVVDGHNFNEIEEESATFNGEPVTRWETNNEMGIGSSIFFISHNGHNIIIDYNDEDDIHTAILSTLEFVTN